MMNVKYHREELRGTTGWATGNERKGAYNERVE